MDTEIANKDAIVRYYDECEVAYKDVWDLDKSMAMHYGYWEPGIKTLRDSLRRMNEVAAQYVEVEKESIVLDAGCGVGGSSFFLVSKYNCQVTGISLSKEQVSKASKNASTLGLEGRVTFKEVDYTQTGFEDNSFDLVWAMESVCHAKNKADFLKEAYRILKPGGRIMVADGYAAKDFDKRETALINKWVHNWAIPNLATDKNFCNDAKNLGFTTIDWKDITPHVMRSSKRLSTLAKMALAYGNLLRFFGKSYGNQSQVNNTIGAIYQYKTIKQGLWRYGIFTAEKPS